MLQYVSRAARIAMRKMPIRIRTSDTYTLQNVCRSFIRKRAPSQDTDLLRNELARQGCAVAAEAGWAPPDERIGGRREDVKLQYVDQGHRSVA